MSEIQDLSHNIGSMSIYEKLGRMQSELADSGFTKSGSNNYQNYTYFELEDLLSNIIPLTIKYETTLIFSFTEHGVLKLKDWNTEKGEISIRVPFPDIESINRGTNRIQSTGAYITYLKRYLLMNMFLIMEKDIVDSNTSNVPGVKKETNKNIPKNTTNLKSKEPANLEDTLEKIRSKIHSKDKTIEITPKVINSHRFTMLKNKEISEEEASVVFEWFKKQEKEAKQ